MTDYLIVGQGVAGSFLSWELLKRGKSICIVDNHHHESSSMMSAGIINPITGKRFVLDESFPMFFKEALSLYAEFEAIFDTKFMELKDIVRIIKDGEELEKFKRKKNKPQYTEYLGIYDEETQSVVIKRGGFCRTIKLLLALRKHFKDHDVLTEDHFQYMELTGGKHQACYKGKKFKQVVFCEGYQVKNNPWFKHLPFNNTKGEILRVQMDSDRLPDAIINRGKWAVPIEGNEWALGATYEWDELNCDPSDQGKKEIMDGVQPFTKGPIKVIKHQAGVRPISLDQNAILGAHPEYPSIGIFNGLGSKGFLTAAYYAKTLVASLENGGVIPSTCDVARFFGSN